MALYTTLASLSQTATANVADGSVDAPSTIDQQTNSLASYSAQLRDGNGFTTGVGNLSQCQLTKSGSNLLLSRFNGIGLTINNVAYAIPSAGVTLAPTGLTVGTLYYIYAYMNSGTMTLEAVTTVPVVDSTSGMKIKTGDASRTLVGMARPITGPAWSDLVNQRFVVSYFNRRPIMCQAGLGSSTNNTSATPNELNTGLRNEFLLWGDVSASFSFDGYAQNSTLGATVASYLSVDGTLLDGYSVFLNTGVSQIAPVSVNSVIGPALSLAEGYHYVTPFVSVNTGTGTWIGSSTAGVRCSLKGLIQG